MATSHLMSEEDVLKYFLQNNGICRNQEIVNYFRFYLSDPNIRDEARALFKSYVNKLANVKTENGEKYLVLKRQYFPPIDGNGNGRPSVPTPQGNYNQLPLQSSSQQQFQASLNNSYGNVMQGYPSSTAIVNRPGPGSSYDSYPPPPASALQHPPLQRSLSQQSQSQSHLHGSTFSLSSNHPYSNNDPYMASNINVNNYSYPQHLSNVPPPSMPNNYLPPQSYPHHHSVVQNSSNSSNYGLLPPIQPPLTAVTNDYMEYGLPPPPVNMVSSPPKRFPSPPSLSNNSNNINNNNNGSPGRLLPPPYRPPPYRPPPSIGQSTPPYLSGPIRNPAPSNVGMNYPPPNNIRYPSSPPNQNFNSSEPTTPTGPPYLIHRSLSVSGSLTSPLQYEAAAGKYFDSNSNLHSSISNPSLPQAPPIPPRSKRERQFVRSVSSKSMMDDSGGDGTGDDGVGSVMTMTERRNSMGAPRGISSSSMLNSNSSDGEGSGQGSRSHLPNNVGGSSGSFSAMMTIDRDNNAYESSEKENVNTMSASYGSRSTVAIDEIGNVEVNGNSSEVEQKISVKERLQKFNRIASESELTASGAKMPSASRNRREVASKHDSVDYDSASLSSFGYSFGSMQPADKEWILKASQCDYHFLNKMAQENPSLVKRKDINGYTALHWAAKHGNAELVKLLAGTFKSSVNAKSNGYTPLHLAAQFSRQDVYDILSQVYNADVNIRDHSGKKPMQYLVRQDSTLSSDTFKKLKDKRRSTEQREQRERDSSFLRIGSLNVRVKKTTEAFNNFLGKSHSATSIERILHKTYGSADNIDNGDTVDRDKQIMPPPPNPVGKNSNGKRKARRSGSQFNEYSTTTTIKESQTDSDSDTACGFGSEWKS